MPPKILRSRMIVIVVLAVTAAALTVLLVQRQGTAFSSDFSQAKQKKLREIAMERDVEVEGVSGASVLYTTLESLQNEAQAIVLGRILDSESFFDESGHPIEYGEIITTVYIVDVLNVLKDRTAETARAPGRAMPAPLSTPLKIARNGGTVHMKNGYRASVKVKGYESLKPGKQYVFFLFWSPDYEAYVLASGIFGALRVNDDLSLSSLASSKEFQSELKGMDLENLAKQVK